MCCTATKLYHLWNTNIGHSMSYKFERLRFKDECAITWRVCTQTEEKHLPIWSHTVPIDTYIPHKKLLSFGFYFYVYRVDFHYIYFPSLNGPVFMYFLVFPCPSGTGYTALYVYSTITVFIYECIIR